MDLSQYGINSNQTNGTGGPIAIPGLEGLQSMLGWITLASVVLGGLFTLLYVINLVQRIRADRAMIAMHKDIAAIKEILEKQVAPHPAPTPQVSASSSTPVKP